MSCAEITTVRPLNLVDLRGDGPVKMGVPTDAVRASGHRLWAAMVARILASQAASGWNSLSFATERVDQTWLWYDVALPEVRVDSTIIKIVFGDQLLKSLS